MTMLTKFKTRKSGVAKIVQGRLSKYTFVHDDFCPRSKYCQDEGCSYFFFSLHNALVWQVSIKKINLGKICIGKSFLGQKSPWTIVCLDN